MDPLSAFAAIAETTTTTHSTIPSTRNEAMVYWVRLLYKAAGHTLKLDKTRITSAAAIQALYEVLPQYPQIKKLDFTLCTFNEEAFTALMAPPESSPYELELAWIPTEQIFLIEAQKVAKFKKLTIHRSTSSPEAYEIDLFIQRVQAIYTDIMGSFHLNLSLCQFSKAQTRPLEDLVPRGLQLEIELPVHLPSLIVPVDISGEKLPQPNEPIPETYEILQDQKATPAKCTANWRNLLEILEGEVTTFNLNDSNYAVFSKATNPISTFFKEVEKSRHQVDTLDLTDIIFSIETWEALLQSLNNHKSKFKKLIFDSISLDQIEALFKQLSDGTLQSLEELDLSRTLNIRTSPQDKDRLSAILSEHLPKLKLKKLTLNNWLLEDKHLDFAKGRTEIHLTNHWVKTPPSQVQLNPAGNATKEETAVFANSDFDELTLQAVWEMTFSDFNPPEINLGNLDGPDLVIDSSLSIRLFFEKLRSNPQFTALFLGRFTFTDQAWNTLLENLKTTPSITTLELYGCHLTPERIAQLSALTHLKKLSISCNAELTDKKYFLDSLRQVMTGLPNLEELFFPYNLLSDDDLLTLFSSGTPRNALSINLRYNCITDKGKDYLDNLTRTPSPGQKRNSDGETATPCHINYDDNPISSLASKVDPAEEAFQKKLLQFFRIQDIPDDGNCLFHACALGVLASHQELRKRAVDHMKKNKDVFKLYMEDNTNIKAYTIWMSQDTAWGGDVEIAALSQSLEVPIAVYSKEHDTIERDGKLFPHDSCVFGATEGESIFDNPNTIFLYHFNEEHYQRLYPKQA